MKIEVGYTEFIRCNIQLEYNYKCDIFLPENQINSARREDL